jgi:hypothetical protein
MRVARGAEERRRSTRGGGAAAAVVAALGLLCPGLANGAALSPLPDAGMGWAEDSVQTVSTNGPVTFAGSKFGAFFGRAFAGPVAVDPSSGALRATTRGISSGRAVSDGAGGWFLLAAGGRQVLHLDPELHTTLAFPLQNDHDEPGASALHLSPDGTRLYVAGDFRRLLGAARVGVAAVATSNGMLLDWKPQDTFIAEAVDTSPDGSVIYVAGEGSVDGRPFAMGSYRADTGALIVRSAPGEGVTLLATADGGHVLLQRYCGTRCEPSGVPSGYTVESLDPVTLLPQWVRRNTRVFGASATPDGQRAFLGLVRRWDGETFPIETAIQISMRDGTRTDWRSAVPADWAMPSADGTRVYLAVSGEPNLVAVSADGSQVLPWAPVRHSASLMAVGPGDSRVLLSAGGSFDAALRQTGAEFDADGAVTDFLLPVADPGSEARYPSQPTASALSGSGTLYLARVNIIGVDDPATGRIGAYTPGGVETWQHQIPVDRVALSPDQRTLYIAGPFTQVEGVARAGLAALDAVAGHLLPWNPAPNAPGSVRAMAVSHDPATVYLGGTFASVGGVPRRALAAVDAVTGTPTGFRADTAGGVTALALSASGSTVYVAGGFRPASRDGSSRVPIHGVERTHLAALDADDGTVQPWAPAVSGSYGSVEISSLAATPDGGTLFVGSLGETIIDGATRQSLAAFDLVTGLLMPWSPEPTSAVSSLALTPDGRALWVGGAFGAWMTSDGSPPFTNAHVARFSVTPRTVPPAPINVGSPQIAAGAAAGSFACSAGEWSSEPDSYRYRWLVDGILTPGADQATVVVIPDAAGHDVRCTVTARSAGGATSVTSPALHLDAIPAPAVESMPTVTGTGEPGGRLTCTLGRWSGTPTEYAVSWLRDETPIASASASEYGVTTADVDHALRCRVTATNAAGATVALSDPVHVRAAAPAPGDEVTPPGDEVTPPGDEVTLPGDEVTLPGDQPVATAAVVGGGGAAGSGMAALFTAVPTDGPALLGTGLPDRSRPVIVVRRGASRVVYGRSASSRRAARRIVLMRATGSEAATFDLVLRRCSTRRSCTRNTTLVQRVHTDPASQRISIRLGDLNRGRRLLPGRYVLTSRATDAAGNTSAAAHTYFRVGI